MNVWIRISPWVIAPLSVLIIISGCSRRNLTPLSTPLSSPTDRCRIPDISDTVVGKKLNIELNGIDDRRHNVVFTEYAFSNVVEYTPELTTEQQRAGMEPGRFTLDRIMKYSIHSMDFAINVYAREAKKSDNSEHRRLFEWRCLDSDGDGVFELVNSPGAEFRVPQWIVRESAR